MVKLVLDSHSGKVIVDLHENDVVGEVCKDIGLGTSFNLFIDLIIRIKELDRKGVLADVNSVPSKDTVIKVIVDFVIYQERVLIVGISKVARLDLD